MLVVVVSVEEFVERDAVHKALMALLRQDVKGKVEILCVVFELAALFFFSILET